MPSSPRFDSQHSRIFFRRKLNVAEVNQWLWIEASGFWLENVDRTHLALASGNPVLQQSMNGGNSDPVVR